VPLFTRRSFLTPLLSCLSLKSFLLLSPPLLYSVCIVGTHIYSECWCCCRHNSTAASCRTPSRIKRWLSVMMYKRPTNRYVPMLVYPAMPLIDLLLSYIKYPTCHCHRSSQTMCTVGSMGRDASYSRDSMIVRVYGPLCASVCLCLPQVGVLSKQMNESWLVLPRSFAAVRPRFCNVTRGLL